MKGTVKKETRKAPAVKATAKKPVVKATAKAPAAKCVICKATKTTTTKKTTGRTGCVAR